MPCSPTGISAQMNPKDQVLEAVVVKGGCHCLVAKPCPPLCNPMDCSALGSSVHGISQARILEWIAISFFRDS